MKHFLLITSLLIIASLSIQAQRQAEVLMDGEKISKKLAKSHIGSQTFYWLVYGKESYRNETCAEDLYTKSGIRDVHFDFPSGHNYSPEALVNLKSNMDIYNRIVGRYLKKKLGKDWRLDRRKQLAKCHG